MPSPGTPSRFSPFTLFLWALVAIITLYLFAWPPLEGVMARKYWKEVPCYDPKTENRQFFFEFNGKRYISTRKSVWLVFHVAPFGATPGTSGFVDNATCYVRPDGAGKPATAVLAPIAGPTREQLMPRIAIMAMVLAAAGIMTWRARKMAVRPAEAPE